MQVIIPLAGKGTRLRPHTHLIPKPMLKLNESLNPLNNTSGYSSTIDTIIGRNGCLWSNSLTIIRSTQPPSKPPSSSTMANTRGLERNLLIPRALQLQQISQNKWTRYVKKPRLPSNKLQTKPRGRMMHMLALQKNTSQETRFIWKPQTYERIEPPRSWTINDMDPSISSRRSGHPPTN